MYTQPKSTLSKGSKVEKKIEAFLSTNDKAGKNLLLNLEFGRNSTVSWADHSSANEILGKICYFLLRSFLTKISRSLFLRIHHLLQLRYSICIMVLVCIGKVCSFPQLVWFSNNRQTENSVARFYSVQNSQNPSDTFYLLHWFSRSLQNITVVRCGCCCFCCFFTYLSQ